jgi:hypothetical protein
MQRSDLSCAAATATAARSFVLASVTTKQAFADESGWPRELTQNGAHLVFHQPRTDEWKEFRQVTGRMALTVTPREDAIRR